jgi:hypothetical protein
VSKLPDHFTEKYGEGHSHRLYAMLGVSVDKLTRDDLLCVIAWLASDGRSMPTYPVATKEAS